MYNNICNYNVSIVVHNTVSLLLVFLYHFCTKCPVGVFQGYPLKKVPEQRIVWSISDTINPKNYSLLRLKLWTQVFFPYSKKHLQYPSCTHFNFRGCSFKNFPTVNFFLTVSNMQNRKNANLIFKGGDFQ